MERDVDTCTKSPTGEHVWNYTPRPDNCRLGTCRYCDQQRVFEGGMTHTAALVKPAKITTETMEKAVEIAEKSLTRKVTEPAPARRKRAYSRGYKLSAEQKEDIKRRIKAGDKVALIAADFKVTDEVVYIFRRQMGIHGHNGKKPGPAAMPATAPVPPAAPEVKRNGHKHAQKYNTNQGNIMSQMARLSRGEIRTHAAGPVITRYKEMLEETLRAKQGEVKELKAKISVADEALRELNIIQQGEKSAVEKVLAVVR